MSSFVKRKINLKFSLDATAGTFTTSGSNVVTLTGLRVSASIVYQKGGAFGELDFKVFVAPLDVMNKLTILQNAFNANVQNSVEVIAGDDVSGLNTVFVGGIQEAWVDANGAPDVAFIVKGYTSLSSAFQPATPLSFKGSVDVASAAASIAAQMTPQLVLENSGVHIQVSNAYLHGDANNQLRTLARMGNFDYTIDGAAGVLAIWPKGLARGTQGVEISADTDLIGYPAYTQKGIMITTLYNPSVRVGGPVVVKSKVLTPANGQWNPTTIGHDLESETPGGKWFTHLECDVFGRSLDYDS